MRHMCRYEACTEKPAGNLDSALFLCSYATAVLKQSPVGHPYMMQEFRTSMLKTLESIGKYCAQLLGAAV